MKKPETIIEEAYCDWLRDDYPREAAALKLVFFSGKGFPDRTILCEGKIFFIEFKKPGEDLNPLQVKWKRLLIRLGFKYYVSTTVEKAKRITFRNLDRA